MQFDIILGLPFLIDNDARLDLKNNTLTLDGKEYEITNITCNNGPDQRILERSKIMSICSEHETKCKELVSEFVKSSPELGYTNKFQHKITLKTDNIINKKPYKVPHAIMKDCKEELEKLQSLGVIRKSLSPFSSPAFPIKKKNGKIRIVVDYRELNKITVPQYHPLPSIIDYGCNFENQKFFHNLILILATTKYLSPAIL
ncbi:Retrovirus-related Pol polyprotein from transposon [Dictyocoela muelleri]|nr:Retrovirus-related Pol polyprotein from transposon [Dictyocoela muelleri]